MILNRTIHPEIRVLDAKAGTCEYVASDETVDTYHEVIRASGWRFTHFRKNAPFLDSHRNETISDQLGKVIRFEVKGNKLVETVQWAIDVPENTTAQLGWKMTEAGYLRAVSVGFMPVRMVSRWDAQDVNKASEWAAQLDELGLKDNPPRAIYLEQEQVELSACVIGANPNALARSFKAGVINDAELEFLATRQVVFSVHKFASPASVATDADSAAQARARQEILDRIDRIQKSL